MKKLLTGLLLSLISGYSFGQVHRQDAEDFVGRVVPQAKDHFIIKSIPAENGKDVFELYSQGGKIVLAGNKNLSIASALSCYLKEFCHADFGWNGDNMHLPAKLPAVKTKIYRATPYQYRYYLNYCTFNYSASWWDWKRWQHEIDWMALNGINMPLAITGEEAVWRTVYRDMGFTDKQLDGFFSGPAYFSWFWMGNLDAWGGPLPQHWMDTHEALEKKILARERSFGMTPVLPAFTGHVPPAFKDKFPQAKLKKTNWTNGFNDVYILDSDDPMFARIGKKYIEAQTKVYGTDHLYSAETFNENTPPSNDSLYLDAMSKKIYQSMAQADPKAKWVMQAWLFHNNSAFWQTKQIKALLNAVPNNGMILLDLYSEEHPVWQKTDGYYGKPWIWDMLQNFGGNISLFGRMQHVAADPVAALHDPHAGDMVGIGVTPEGIEQNPALFEMMLTNVWRDKAIDPEAWLDDYAMRRYGKKDGKINEGWKILLNTVYNGGMTEGGPESIVCARPTLNKENEWVHTQLFYDPKELVKAWQLFIGESGKFTNSDGFGYDITDITRQVLANYALPLQQKWAKAYEQKDMAAFKKYSAEFLGLMDDMDKLLGTRKDFLLGRWIAEARANGITPQEKDLYEFNARDLVTLWGGKNSPLHEYSCRQWSGLIKGFYKPRWEKFFGYLNSAKGAAPDMKEFDETVKNWEWQWVNSHSEHYAPAPQGSSVAIAQALYKKYYAKALAAEY
ncbi:MAG TPA: alpha-N-acetylglucosaminidase [Mucilaginibacter sp.]|nr:alpha-N-acetylglucosaminidase [Mucilaginibacter sp.]